MNITNSDKWARVRSLLEASGVVLDSSAVARIDTYVGLIESYGKAFGVVSCNDIANGLTTHVFDSLSIVPYVREAVSTGCGQYVDVGTGGGFPGVVCGSCLPDVRTVLMDRSEKKCSFLRRVLAELDVDNIGVFCGLFSKFSWSGDASVVTVRGLERVHEQLPILLDFLPVGSQCLWLTGDASLLDLGERFHVEQIVDDWSESGLRRGSFYRIEIRG